MYNSRDVFFWFRNFTANIVCLIPAVERPKTRIKSKGVRRRARGRPIKYRRRKRSSCPPSCQLDQTKYGYRHLGAVKASRQVGRSAHTKQRTWNEGCKCDRYRNRTRVLHTFTLVKTTAIRVPKLRVTTHTKVITETAAIAVT